MAVALVAVVGLSLGACGGGDDADSSTTTTTIVSVAATDPPTSSTSTTSTTSTTLAQVAYVTEGATVIVANSSGINGAAGRLSDRLAAVGYTMGAATNGSEGQLNTTKIYFDPSNTAAEAVADSLRLALGGGAIQLFEMGVPAPIESGDPGDATVIVSMGNDVADQSLDVLQGLAAAPVDTTTDATDTTTESSTPSDG
jgi:hypothetical protein